MTFGVIQWVTEARPALPETKWPIRLLVQRNERKHLLRSIPWSHFVSALQSSFCQLICRLRGLRCSLRIAIPGMMECALPQGHLKKWETNTCLAVHSQLASVCATQQRKSRLNATTSARGAGLAARHSLTSQGQASKNQSSPGASELRVTNEISV